MAGIIKTKTFLASTLNAEFKGVSSVPTKGGVGTGTTAAGENDTDLETPVDIDGDNFKEFQINYPSVNTVALSAETRFRLGTTDANGNLITEMGNFDASDNLKDRATFSSFSKTSSDIGIFSTKTKVRNVQP